MNFYRSLASSTETTVLVIGGGYLGISAVKTLYSRFVQHLENHNLNLRGASPKKLKIHMVEPKSGLLNVLGMLKSAVDIKFAATQYVDFADLQVPWTTAILQYESVLDKFKNNFSSVEGKGIGNENLLELVYVQGKVIRLGTNSAQVALESSSNSDLKVDHKDDGSLEGRISFQYCILATGRDRMWPATPIAQTKDQFLGEVKNFHDSLSDKQIISVVGAGAVGIEFAGDLKHHFPNKTVQLIHPHENFPPEDLSIDFKNAVKKSLLDSGVEIIHQRVALSTKNGDLLTTNGEIIDSDYTFWATSHKNNYDILESELQRKYVNSKGDITTNEYLQLSDGSTTVANMFATGDLMEAENVIKSAGMAMYTGMSAANCIASLCTTGNTSEPIPKRGPKGMLIVAGNGDIVLQNGNDVAVNLPQYLEEFKDYRFGSVRRKLSI